MNKSKIFFPENLSAAIKVLNNESVVPIAGGTSLLLNLPQDIKLLDLESLGLNYIKFSKNYLKIGAMTTISKIIESDIIKKYCNSIIKDASLTIASTPNRNLITIGGNIVGIHPWSVFPGLLMLLDGKVITAKNKIIDSEKLFSSTPKNVLGKDIVTEIQFPNFRKNIITYWKKFSLTETDYPIVSVGIFCEKQKDIIKNIKIVAIGLTLFPQRFKKTEKMLQNKKISEKIISDTIESIKNELKVSNDIRVSIDYKKEILSVLIQEFLTKLI